MQSPIGSIVFLVILFAVFWLLLLRPQKKRAEMHRQLIESVQPGDEIVTIGGVFGRVESVADDALEVEIAAGTRIRLLKSAVARKLTEDEPEEDEELDEAEEAEAEEEGHA